VAARRLHALQDLEEPPERARPSERLPGGASAHPTMSRANPFWGAPRIHGELQKLGEIAQATVSQVSGPPPRSGFSAPTHAPTGDVNVAGTVRRQELTPLADGSDDGGRRPSASRRFGLRQGASERGSAAGRWLVTAGESDEAGGEALVYVTAMAPRTAQAAGARREPSRCSVPALPRDRHGGHRRSILKTGWSLGLGRARKYERTHLVPPSAPGRRRGARSERKDTLAGPPDRRPPWRCAACSSILGGRQKSSSR
jgi:hypothetical protein